ncbi:MAG: LptF/LptG family permease [Prochloraceae cyanobacterium]
MKIKLFKLFKLRIPDLSVMDRYISAELILPFLFGMGLFTSLGLAIGALFQLVRDVTESGLLLDIALKVLFLKMPEYLVLAFPMSVLLATLMGYSRLASDSELIALRSSGVSTYRMVIPSVILSLLVVGLTFICDDLVVPASNYQASVTLDRAFNKQKPSFKERNIIYPEYKKTQEADGNQKSVLTRLFYAKEFDGQQMKGLTIIDRSQKGIDRIFIAASATWNAAENVWDFYNGTMYEIAADGTYGNIIRFERRKLKLSKAPLDLAKRGRDYDEMNIFQAREYLNILRMSGDRQKIRQLQVQIQAKIAFPFVCLVFALVGAAIGLKPQNTGKATSFGICIVLIFSYYLLSFISNSMGIWGVLSPFMAAWLPNFLGLGAGGFLLVNSSK